MKKYIIPQTISINVCTENIIAASGDTTEEIDGPNSGGTGDGTSLSRQKQGGFGKGLWED